MDLHDDIGCGTGRHRDATPRCGFEVPETLLVQRHDFRSRVDAPERGHADRAHAATSHRCHRRYDRPEKQIDMPAHRVGQRRAGALVGDVDHSYAGNGLEELGPEVAGSAIARGRVTQPVRSRLRQCDELCRVPGGHGWMNDDDTRILRQVRDVREISQDIEIEPGEKRRVDCIGDRRSEQHVPVGRRFRRGLRADVGAAAGTVFHDHWNSPCFSEFLSNGARQDVGSTARRIRDDPADRLHRKSNRLRGRGTDRR